MTRKIISSVNVVGGGMLSSGGVYESVVINQNCRSKTCDERTLLCITFPVCKNAALTFSLINTKPKNEKQNN